MQHLALLCILLGKSILLSQPRKEVSLEHHQLLFAGCTEFRHNVCHSILTWENPSNHSLLSKATAVQHWMGMCIESPAIKNCLFFSTSCALKSLTLVPRVCDQGLRTQPEGVLNLGE